MLACEPEPDLTRLYKQVKEMNRCTRERERSDIRVGHGSTVSECSISEALGDGASKKAVVLDRLVGEPEETEEDECAEDGSPSSQL